MKETLLKITYLIKHPIDINPGEAAEEVGGSEVTNVRWHITSTI